jgi:flagellar assembly protein FliH
VSKNVFKSMEIIPTDSRISIEIPEFNKIQIKEESGQIETYEGKTIEDLKREAEDFEKNFDSKKQEMLSGAEVEAREVVEKAEKEAFALFKKKNDEILQIKQDADDTAKEIIARARLEAKNIESEIQDKEAKILSDARKRGYQEGWEEGFKKGEDEVARLVDRIQIILNSTIEKRSEIFVETEQQVINLVLLIAKKVIKVISENQKNVVINNVVQALRKLKSRGDVAIRVNLADLELTSQHKKDFVEMVEGVKSIRILEDSTVDKGGCIIETDFGSIDARISSQLHEIEDRILELMPIQSKGKSENPV